MMRIQFQIILFLNILLIASVYLHAKDYRGILPLHSTRADVISVFGEAPKTNEPDDSNVDDTYSFENEKVSISYSSKLIVDIYKCEQPPASNTVMIIEIFPQKDLPLSDLQIDVTGFRKFMASERDANYQSFLNEEEGIGIFTLIGVVEKIVYFPAKKDRNLCSKYYEPIEDYLLTRSAGHPDSWSGPMTNKEIKKYLGFFYPVLRENPTQVLVLMMSGIDKDLTIHKARFLKALKAHKYDMRRIRFLTIGKEPVFRVTFLVLPAKLAVPKDS